MNSKWKNSKSKKNSKDLLRWVTNPHLKAELIRAWFAHDPEFRTQVIPNKKKHFRSREALSEARKDLDG